MKLHLVLHKCGDGAVFESGADAESAISGKFRVVSSALAQAFYELYPDDTRLVEIEVPDQKEAA